MRGMHCDGGPGEKCLGHCRDGVAVGAGEADVEVDGREGRQEGSVELSKEVMC
jgi:hypothetical protein